VSECVRLGCGCRNPGVGKSHEKVFGVGLLHEKVFGVVKHVTGKIKQPCESVNPITAMSEK
jgi:hypothetical protein